MDIDTDRSNVLADLAVRINAEHEAACGAVKSGAEHAMAAGDLLIEAKAKLDQHGGWLPWLKQNCGEISERTAQLYMRMARNREAIEANAQHVADLSLRGAMAVIAPPKPDDSDRYEWAAQQLEEPFTDWDAGDDNYGWMQTKLAHCAGLPVNVQWALSLAREFGLPALAVCSATEIMNALVLIAPYAKWEGKYKMGVSEALSGSISVLMAAQAIVVALFGEVEACEKLSAARLAKRASKVIEALSLVIDAKKAKWAELKARPISDEEKFKAGHALLKPDRAASVFDVPKFT
jgi:hypothetical protein